jgi:hypothetical protein
VRYFGGLSLFKVTLENGYAANQPSGAGGGIYNDLAGELHLIQNTFWGNRALIGGGIYNLGGNFNPPDAHPQVELDNNTVAHNFAQLGGGGIYNLGFIFQFVSNLVAENIDFSHNSPDMFSAASGINQPPAGNPPVGAIAEGFNLIGNCHDQCGLTNDHNDDIVAGNGGNPPIDARLHRLANNSGPTETVLPFPDSPAVNNGYNKLNLAFDQRGPRFFRTVAQTDIGSVEVQYDSKQ